MSDNVAFVCWLALIVAVYLAVAHRMLRIWWELAADLQRSRMLLATTVFFPPPPFYTARK